MTAPVVVAKGRNLIAEKIREIATRAGIPIVENIPLAQALFKAVELGDPIPSVSILPLRKSSPMCIGSRERKLCRN